MLWSIHILETCQRRLTATLVGLETIPTTPRIERLINMTWDLLQITSQELQNTIENAANRHVNSDSGRETQSQ